MQSATTSTGPWSFLSHCSACWVRTPWNAICNSLKWSPGRAVWDGVSMKDKQGQTTMKTTILSVWNLHAILQTERWNLTNFRGALLAFLSLAFSSGTFRDAFGVNAAVKCPWSNPMPAVMPKVISKDLDWPDDQTKDSLWRRRQVANQSVLRAAKRFSVLFGVGPNDTKFRKTHRFCFVSTFCDSVWPGKTYSVLGNCCQPTCEATIACTAKFFQRG